MKTFIFSTQGTKLHGIIKGNPEAKHIFITLHGGPGGNKEDMAKVGVCKWLEKEHLCVYFDQRGCGDSEYDLKQGVTPLMLKEDVKKVVEEIKKRYPAHVLHLLGFSFGGYLGFLTVDAYKGLVDDYIACNPAITFSRQEALDMFQRVQVGYDQRFSQLKKTQDVPEEVMQSKEFRDFVFSKQNTANSLRYMYAMSTWFFTIDFTIILKDITMPTLIFQGEEDKICHEKNLQKVLSKIQNPCIKYFSLPGCSHDIDEISTRTIIEKINNYLKEEF